MGLGLIGDVARGKMRVLILGINYAPEPVGIAIYTTGLATGLAAEGCEVEVVAAQPYYPTWRIATGFSRWRWTASHEDGVRVLRCPHYIPRNPGGARRILHHLSFALSALIPVVWRARRRPDVVFVVAPSILAAPVGWLAARLSGARIWLHLQDFEAEAAVSTGLLRAGGVSGRLALWFERRMLAAADRVSAISPQMCARLAAKGVPAAKIHELRNWASLDHVRPLDRPSAYRAEFGVATPQVALYSGNIANKQGVEIIVEAARALRGRNDLTFVVCGEGPNLAQLKSLAAGLPNIRFHPLQPKERLGELLGLATIHLLPQIAGAADLVLPSKLANMFASGRPVVATTVPGAGIAEEVADCGLITPPGDAAAFASAIARLADDPTLAARLGAAGRARAEARWDKASVIENFRRAAAALSRPRRR
ncbi:WcaI family glycosyltransferase [bacterium]|nr:WcaI family glycosyltransferase [bacterium]